MPAKAKTTTPVKVLSIRQPFADLIIRGIKWCENRTWNTHYRGRLYIHASSGAIDSHYTDDFIRKKCKVKSNKEFRKGCILGHVELVDVAKIEFDDADQQFELAEEMKKRFSLSDKDDSVMHVSGPYCLILTEPVELEEPIYCKGALNIWDFDL